MSKSKLQVVTDPPREGGMFGVCCDEIEQALMTETVKRVRLTNPVSALDVDCGDGRIGVSMAKQGAHVLVTHPNPATEDYLLAKTHEAEVSGMVHFKALDLSAGHGSPNAWDWKHQLPGAPFDLVACLHTLHFLPYVEAKQFLRHLIAQTRIGGKIFLSALGMLSELGDTYPHRDQFIASRFSPLGKTMSDKYDIYRPVCLYSERDLFLMMFESGIGVLKSWTTTHGTVKAIGVRV